MWNVFKVNNKTPQNDTNDVHCSYYSSCNTHQFYEVKIIFYNYFQVFLDSDLTLLLPRLHIGEKPFKCPDCDAAFHRKSYLTEHMFVHTGVSKYQCQECKVSSINWQLVTKHFYPDNIWVIFIRYSTVNWSYRGEFVRS